MNSRVLRFPASKEIFRALRSGLVVSDADFDRLYPEEIRNFSEIHWTPVAVAKRAAELLVRGRETRVLDVGSGCGKFCLVGGATTRGAFTGVEQRRHLAVLSHRIAVENSVTAEFFFGDLRGVDWRRFNAFYLYNPFAENLYPKKIRIDQSVEFTQDRFVETVRLVQMRLHLLEVGTRVMTYHGFGGEMPPGYEVTFREPHGNDELVLWEKTKESA